MNVDHIYQLQRDEAFAKQFSADKYQTFVAMPFNNRGGYPEARIKMLLLQERTQVRFPKLNPSRRRQTRHACSVCPVGLPKRSGIERSYADNSRSRPLHCAVAAR